MLTHDRRAIGAEPGGQKRAGEHKLLSTDHAQPNCFRMNSDNGRKSMQKIYLSMGIILVGLSVSMSAGATYNANASGTIVSVYQPSSSFYPPESFIFTITNQPTPTTSCGGYNRFIIDSTTTTDAETRRNMVAVLLAAKFSGTFVTISYDSTGGGCYQGEMVVYAVSAS